MAKATDIERISRIMLDEFKRLHGRFDDADRRFDDLSAQVSSLASEVGTIHRRLDTLDEAIGNVAGFAKEIDHLLNRVSEIEKHLGLNSHTKA